jgi:hypothetical protein
MEKKILSNGRKQVSTRTRFEIFKRDLFTCQYCGATPPGVLLHVDHIIAVANGGGNDRDNLVTACQGCNLGKSAIPLTSVPQSLKDKSKEVAEREKQIHGYNAILQAKRDRIENEAWAIAAALERMEYIDSYNRRNLVSIRMFLERLSYQEVLDAVDVTVSRWGSSGSRAFRYFCAVCWNKIKESKNGSD